MSLEMFASGLTDDTVDDEATKSLLWIWVRAGIWTPEIWLYCASVIMIASRSSVSDGSSVSPAGTLFFCSR